MRRHINSILDFIKSYEDYIQTYIHAPVCPPTHTHEKGGRREEGEKERALLLYILFCLFLLYKSGKAPWQSYLLILSYHLVNVSFMSL